MTEEQKHKAVPRTLQWVKDNPERARATRQAYYAKNKEKIAAI